MKNKFRVYDKQFGLWMAEEVIGLSGDGRLIDLLGINNPGLNDGYQAGNIIVQRFTGKLDKNGKEIYIGDIVKWIVKIPGWIRYDYEYDEWKKDGAKPQIIKCTIKSNYDLEEGAFADYKKNPGEIIGNIFDKNE